MRVFAHRSGCRAYHALSENSGNGSDDWILVLLLVPLWLASKLYNVVRFRGGWSVVVLRKRRFWKDKVLRTERFSSEAQAKDRAAAIVADLQAG